MPMAYGHTMSKESKFAVPSTRTNARKASAPVTKHINVTNVCKTVMLLLVVVNLMSKLSKSVPSTRVAKVARSNDSHSHRMKLNPTRLP